MFSNLANEAHAQFMKYNLSYSDMILHRSLAGRRRLRQRQQQQQQQYCYGNDSINRSNSNNCWVGLFLCAAASPRGVASLDLYGRRSGGEWLENIWVPTFCLKYPKTWTNIGKLGKLGIFCLKYRKTWKTHKMCRAQYLA